jgi:tRNA G10  N-methylase Trm11
MKILAQCIAGLQDLVLEQLQAQGHIQKLLIKEEGFLVFDTTVSIHEIRNFIPLNNSFLILVEGDKNLKHLDQFLSRLAGYSFSHWKEKISKSQERSFRLRVADENKLVSCDPHDMSQLAHHISKATGLMLSPRGADIEFWLFRRRNGKMFFCQRLSQREYTEKNLRQGELRPELTHSLCFLSDPQPDDIFLDPFAGSGAIGAARSRMPYNMLFLSDIDDKNVKEMKSALKAGKIRESKKSPVIVRQSDARDLKKIDDSFIDKIVTDPPWGFFEADIPDLMQFYQEVFHELCRVVKTEGLIVALLGRRDLLDTLVEMFQSDLLAERRYDILVSGKKASIIRWRRL